VLQEYLDKMKNSINPKFKSNSNMEHQRLKKRKRIRFLNKKIIKKTKLMSSIMSLKIHCFGKQSNKVRKKHREIKNKKK